MAAVVLGALVAGPSMAAPPGPAPSGPAGEQRMLKQVPLVDAATVVRTATETLEAAGLASIVIEERSVAVWWKGGRQALPAQLAAVIEEANRIAPVRVANARFSKSELLAASAQLEARLRTQNWFHGIKAQPDGSGLVVKSDATGARTAGSALPTVGVPAILRVEERLRPVSRENDSSPWSGGAEIINRSIGAGCTSGFGVNTPGGPAVLTAGHCGETGHRMTDGAGEFIGNVGADDNNFDVQVIPTNAVSNRIYVGGADSTQQRTVTGGGAPFIGERLCQSGNTSANAVGRPICNLEVQFEYTDSQRLWEARQLDGQTAARPGDSGGPVYLDRGDGTVTARGTTTRVAGSGFGFAGFEKAQQRFSVSIPGAGAGRTGPVVSAATNKCLDISSSGTADGTKVQIWTCNGTGAQRWTINGGTVSGLGKCLDVRSGGTTNGTVVQLWTCNGTGAQVWSVQPNGSLLNPQSGKCLDVAGNGTTDGTQIQIWDCVGAANQRWTFPA
ncbi:RICIN domain-containing protein [Micromonospora sp. URMC 105]|uniref:RICIN domain-containing protein n=1 Tax=Micromonospora sp. URMC 105 TaxID=3423413 RepID=UPI003F1C0958